MATFTTGRSTALLVAVFALLVEGVLGFRSLGAVVTAATLAGVNTFVVTYGAVSHFGLVSLVLEGDLAHFSFEGDGLRAVGSNGDGSDAQKADGNQSNDDAFHTCTSIEK